MIVQIHLNIRHSKNINKLHSIHLTTHQSPPLILFMGGDMSPLPGPRMCGGGGGGEYLHVQDQLSVEIHHVKCKNGGEF